MLRLGAAKTEVCLSRDPAARNTFASGISSFPDEALLHRQATAQPEEYRGLATSGAIPRRKYSERKDLLKALYNNALLS